MPDPDELEGPEAGTAPGGYRKQVLRNTAATGLSNGWTMVVALVSVPLLLRGLGQAAFGTWVLLQTFSALTGWLSLADLGLGMATTRAVADRASLHDDLGVEETIGSSLATATAIAAACALVLATAGRAVLPAAFKVPDDLVGDLQLALIPFAAQVVLELAGSMVGFCLDGLQRVDRSRAIESLRRTLVMGASVVVALATNNLVNVLIAGAVATAVATIVAAVVLDRSVPLTRLRATRARGRELLHYGRRVWLLNGTGVIHRTVDRTVVGVILGPAAVALVEIATQVQNGVAATMSATSYAATTSAAWVHARDSRDRLAELLLRGTKYVCLVTLPLCAVVAVLAEPLIDVWLRGKYTDAAGLVALAVAYLATQAPLATGSNLLVGIGRAGAVIVPAAVAVTVNVAASIVLVKTHGVAGAFVATILSGLVLTPLLARAVATSTGIAVGDVVRHAVVPTLWPAIGAGSAALAVRALGLGSFATLLAGGALAAVAWFGLGAAFALGPGERGELRTLLRRG